MGRTRRQQHGELFRGYLDPKRPHAEAYDEMFAPDSTVRQAYRRLHDSLAPSSAADLTARSEALDRALVDQGITFSLSGQERPFPLDLIPRVITAQEWSRLERGIVQRVRALEAFLADVYGDQQIIRDGVLPRRLITSCQHFHRQAAGVNPPNGVRVHVSGVDIVRDADGVFRVLEDNLRCPSGVSYVMENRRTMARVFPDLFAKHRVRAVGDYAVHLLRSLRAAAAPNVADPMVVVLTPGVHNSAYFEHSLLARQMGVELVEGRDLFCRDNAVYVRTTEGERQVDVVYRRIDDEFLDPVHFRPDSVLGVAGLLNAARAGNVVIANAVGNGVGDDKLVYAYLPEIMKYYLGETPLLSNVDTFRCWLPDERAQVLDRTDELVVKPVEGSGGYGIVFGPDATAKELNTLRRKIRSDPRSWIAQPVVQLSTVPTKVGGRLRPRHVDLRPFAVNDGESVFVLPGGLTRVAIPEGSLVVNSSQGGGSKDTWVLAARSSTVDAELSGHGLAAGSTPEEVAPDQGPELTSAQQQQQQQQ
ncbi:putative circularly permuted ATP-grasp superfamily protein [Herbihabitans rhizosphaerae]|uniref:Putative circularly permuted ATP-grasp superfamily protein n=1 Tax=Herbihabitans rhizosphaerae TaxID=1872711 RepID=A0A4Q7KGV3_9PSEU|nr:circularly permuted type 2 ATP-grasp protein [Herbihabitans rhizosphaerae]RZS31422.1 putative circularly permuted ATP-grasp superfamily protein [Herbihabitans rhizosphaerae]